MTSLIFGLINFLILGALLYWLFMPSANQFFYSRRMRIRKQMLDSVMTLRQARGHLNRSRELYEAVPKDIEERREAIARNCDRECGQIIEDANKKAAHMLKAGERRAQEERRRHASLIREHLMRAAFRIAEERIKKSSGPKMQRRHAEKGLDRLTRVSADEREVPGSRSEVART